MDRTRATSAGKRHAHILFWCLGMILAGSMLLPLSGYLYVELGGSQAVAAAQDNAGVNPIANFWRAVREGDEGYSSASGPYTTKDFIMSSGESWREVRNGIVGLVAATVILGVLLLVILFHLIKGPKRLAGSDTGRMLERWSGGDRLLHWYTATLFILLSITGFSILFGRAVLLPLLGPEGFAAYASLAKPVHDFLGPLFLVGVILEVIVWMPMNFFKPHDWVWLKSLGGMFRTHDHPPAGRTNGGEKVWFWFIATFGLLGVGISGVVLDFPNFGQSRETMQVANLVHAVFAAFWVAIAIGHIYLGTLGVKGTLQGMTRGQVSEQWMKEHHNLWYEELQAGNPSTSSTPASQPNVNKQPQENPH